MVRVALAAGLLLGGFLAGLAAALLAVDRLMGGDGPTLTLEHRRALDEDDDWDPRVADRVYA
jgi:hypothetical protein